MLTTYTNAVEKLTRMSKVKYGDTLINSVIEQHPHLFEEEPADPYRERGRFLRFQIEEVRQKLMVLALAFFDRQICLSNVARSRRRGADSA